jgi:hypothetical protein
MTTFQHTETPWQSHKYPSIHGGYGFQIRNAAYPGIVVLSIQPGINSDRIESICEANAKFIVTACNSYDEMVMALEQIARLSSEGEVSANMQYALGDIARAALTKTKG